MKTLRVPLVAAYLFAAAAWSLAQVPQLGGSSGKPPAAHPPSSPTSFTLYNQNDNGTGNGWTSQDFETAFDGYDSESADDFVVPAGVFWTISGIHVAGRYFNGAGPAPTVHVHFYNDAAGLPGAAACNYLDVVPTDTAGSFDIALPVPCVLGPGTHWVSVIAHMDVGNGGQWGWDDRSVQTGNPSAWRNPGGTFGTPCADFGARVATCGVGAAPDFGFTLTGTAGGVIPPGPPECGESTMYFENATPVPVADVGVVTSTIVVTGADPYLWDLNAVTYLRHTFSADLDVTITSPAGTVVTLTTDNGGGNDDVFNGTVWDDQADPGSQVPYAGSPNLATDHTYANLVTASPLAPEEALGAFIGEDPNGTWTLTISDDLAGDTGTLDGWGLQVTTLPEALRPTLSYLITNSSAVAIPTGPAVVTSTIDASGDPGTFLCGVKATTHILHTFAADLDVTLMSPSGIIVTLTTDNGAGNDNVFDGTVWDDKANPGGQVPYTTNDGLVTDQAYVNLTPVPTLVPEEGMAAFNGQDPRGVWTLTISDDLAGDGGSLDSWGLELKTCTCAIAVPDGPVRVDQHASSGTSNVNGVLESGETVEFEPSWHNSGSGSIILLSPFISNFDGPVGPTYNTVDSGADYGLIAGGTSANCYDASSNCYEVSVTAALRPMQHWDTTLKETANEVSAPGHADAPSGVTTWTLHVGESFPDVPTSNLFYPFIENIFHNGVTGGCAPPPNYCPGNFTLRKQMAVFVLKSKEGSAYTPPAAVGIFTDVPQADPFAPWIEELYNRGVVAGCGGGAYCPDSPVLRQQMAVFLLKTLLGSGYTPPAAAGLFGDVPIANPFAPWIEDLYNRSIAAGCGSGNFCPTNSTTRGQMAPFLVKTFGMLLYGP